MFLYLVFCWFKPCQTRSQVLVPWKRNRLRVSETSTTSATVCLSTSLKRKQDQVLVGALYQHECYIVYVCSIKTKRSKSNVFLPMYPQPCHRRRVCKTPTWQKVPSGEEALPSLTLNNLSYLQIFWLLLICLLSESYCQTRQSQVVLFFISTTHPPWTQDTKT